MLDGRNEMGTGVEGSTRDTLNLPVVGRDS